jgi:Ala-tRNA(Pro) deacylase
MAIASRVEGILRERGIPYDVVAHPHSGSSLETAELAHVPGSRIAKTVVLEDEQGYVAAVVPANNKLDLGELHRQLKRNLGLATEPELAQLFDDCEIGALPPMAMAYGVETVVDDSLAEQPEIYFEAGDHEQLIRVTGEHFQSLMGEVQHSCFSHPE